MSNLTKHSQKTVFHAIRMYESGLGMLHQSLWKLVGGGQNIIGGVKILQ